jgi:hypothetical protein
MNRKYNFNDESSMSPQAKAAMDASHKKSDARRRAKVGREQWEKEMEQYNIQKAQFEKELKEKKEREMKNKEAPSKYNK